MYSKGKIISFIGGKAKILLEDKSILTANVKGIFRHKSKSISPLVGDNVKIKKIDNTFIIEQIYERKNSLIRPRVTNIDEILIIQSIKSPDLNLFLLDKLIAYYQSQIDNVTICFTKLDLLNENETLKIDNIIDIYKSNGYTVYRSNNDVDLEQIKYNFNNEIICLVGNSGVGKSTLLNKIDPELKLKTQEISKALNRGKHTTTSNQLILTKNGMFIDTPGFSSINICLTPAQLSKSFLDFRKYSSMCKFTNCLHINEPDCKIKQLVKLNKIDINRYNNYLKMREEIKKSSKN